MPGMQLQGTGGKSRKRVKWITPRGLTPSGWLDNSLEHQSFFGPPKIKKLIFSKLCDLSEHWGWSRELTHAPWWCWTSWCNLLNPFPALAPCARYSQNKRLTLRIIWRLKTPCFTQGARTNFWTDEFNQEPGILHFVDTRIHFWSNCRTQVFRKKYFLTWGLTSKTF